MTKKIDINCDMGESYYDNKIGNDAKIMPFITSCNIACGFHGGDPKTIGSTPSALIAGKIIGTVSKIIPMPSKNIPRTK